MKNKFLVFLLFGSSCIFCHSLQASEQAGNMGIAMVDIPTGSFLMGSCKLTAAVREENRKRAFLGQPPLASDCSGDDEDADDDESPQHRVTVKAFQMSRTEVTVGQFKQFIAAAKRIDLLSEAFMKHNAYGDDVPVVYVNWHDAKAFIDWLNKTDEAGGYRLPTEAEWEYACRAGRPGNFCGGDDVDALAWHAGNSGGRPQPVAGKQANAFGLYDMSGNVWEWVEDCRHNSYRGAPEDGSAWTSGCRGDHRGLRGGSWYVDAKITRAAYRGSYLPTRRNAYYGFRIARSR